MITHHFTQYRQQVTDNIAPNLTHVKSKHSKQREFRHKRLFRACLFLSYKTENFLLKKS